MCIDVWKSTHQTSKKDPIWHVEWGKKDWFSFYFWIFFTFNIIIRKMCLGILKCKISKGNIFAIQGFEPAITTQSLQTEAYPEIKHGQQSDNRWPPDGLEELDSGRLM